MQTGYYYNSLGHLCKIGPVDPAELPPGCTLKPPPRVPDGFVAVFYEDEGSWDMEHELLAQIAFEDSQDALAEPGNSDP